MHEYQRKFRLLAALQARRPLDPTRYPGADGRAYQPEKFVVLLSAQVLLHVAAHYHYGPDGLRNPMLNLNPC